MKKPVSVTSSGVDDVVEVVVDSGNPVIIIYSGLIRSCCLILLLPFLVVVVATKLQLFDNQKKFCFLTINPPISILCISSFISYSKGISNLTIKLTWCYKIRFSPFLKTLTTFWPDRRHRVDGVAS